MYPIQINTWYNVIPDQKTGIVELAKICCLRDERYHVKWHIITYYNGTDLFCGTLNDCLHWINSHCTKRRYLDE